MRYIMRGGSEALKGADGARIHLSEGTNGVTRKITKIHSRKALDDDEVQVEDPREASTDC